MIMDDETWFYCESLQNGNWFPSNKDAPIHANRKIARDRPILPVSWNRHGFHIVTIPPKDASFNAASGIHGMC
jgi:hypothetical protein